MNMTSETTHFAWRSFDEIPSGPEAVLAAASCSFSLATLEVASIHDSSGFAITERRQPDVWRWAVIGKDGAVLEEGCEPSRDEAKRAAAEALNLAEDEDGDLPGIRAADLGQATA